MSRLIPVWLHATRLLVGVNYVAAEVSTITLGGFLGLSVNHVAADLSTIRNVLPGTPCQLCRDFGHHILRQLTGTPQSREVPVLRCWAIAAPL